MGRKKSRGRNTPYKVAIAGVVVLIASLVGGSQWQKYKDAKEIQEARAEDASNEDDNDKSLDEQIDDYLETPDYLKYDAEEGADSIVSEDVQEDGEIIEDEQNTMADLGEMDSDTTQTTERVKDDDSDVKYDAYSLNTDDDYSYLLNAFLLDSLSDDLKKSIDSDVLNNVNRSEEPYKTLKTLDNLTTTKASLIGQYAEFSGANGKVYKVTTRMTDGKIVDIRVKEG